MVPVMKTICVEAIVLEDRRSFQTKFVTFTLGKLNVYNIVCVCRTCFESSAASRLIREYEIGL
jgi:hypothetical protein